MCFRSLTPPPLPGLAGPQEDEQYPEDDKYTNELLNLVKQEGGENPAFENYNSNFEDQYGDLHDWQSGTATQHYLCRQLYLHYTQQVGALHYLSRKQLHMQHV